MTLISKKLLHIMAPPSSKRLPLVNLSKKVLKIACKLAFHALTFHLFPQPRLVSNFRIHQDLKSLATMSRPHFRMLSKTTNAIS